MSITVRERRNADLTALAEILVRVHARDGYPVEGVADPLAWLSAPRQIAAWTAVDDGNPIGQAVLTAAAPDDDAAKLWHDHTGGNIERLAIPARLFIDPTGRQRGAGAALMQAIRDHANAHDLALAFDVMLKDQAAIRLYERLGCVRIGTTTHRHGDSNTEPAAVYCVPK